MDLVFVDELEKQYNSIEYFFKTSGHFDRAVGARGRKNSNPGRLLELS